MTSAVLQCIAVVTMLVDHLGYELFPSADWMRMIGRLSFPIFAFMLAEGFVHTSQRKKYVLRLAAFAVVSEVPYQLFARHALWRIPPWSNIMFALLLAFFALWCVERGRLWYEGAVAAVAAAEALGFMYGGYGILLAMAFYIFREKRWAAMASLAALTVIHCLYSASWFQVWAIGAAVPLFFYNGQKGQRLPRYFCYAFYPVHTLAIYGLYLLQKVI